MAEPVVQRTYSFRNSIFDIIPTTLVARRDFTRPLHQADECEEWSKQNFWPSSSMDTESTNFDNMLNSRTSFPPPRFRFGSNDELPSVSVRGPGSLSRPQMRYTQDVDSMSNREIEDQIYEVLIQAIERAERAAAIGTAMESVMRSAQAEREANSSQQANNSSTRN
ncbi:hypothetical protein BC829DRAFT_439001 [Chytridium lagenaria]|nr:hypothetical protein BC829DRAFT_439001 [Chytridium lagenaria]